MQELITRGIGLINTLSGGNQFIGGVLTASVTGGVMWALKDLPLAIKKFLTHQFTTELVLNNAGFEKEQTFNKITRYIQEHAIKSLSRSLIVDTRWSPKVRRNDMAIAIGFGRHIFFFEGKPLLVHRAEHPNNQGETIKEILRITSFGRSHKTLERLIDVNRPKHDNGISMMQYNGKEWITRGRLYSGGLDTIALDPALRVTIRQAVQSFLDGRDEYIRLGLAHKLSAILYGEPGSGKTSLIRAIACEFKLNICTLNLAQTSDNGLVVALGDLPRRSILLMEDFDSASAVRGGGGDEIKKDDSESLLGGYNTRAGILNALDGICGLNEVIVFMTTNHINEIDSAIKRAGRTDMMLELPPVSAIAIQDHFTTLFPALADRNIPWSTLPGCVIHKVKQTGLGNPDKVEETLRFYFDNPELAHAEQRGKVEYLSQLKQIEAMAALSENSER